MKIKTANASDFQAGDIVKVKQTDKTRSPYSRIVSIDHDAKTLAVDRFDAVGNGNRRQRRAKFAAERKQK